jgi:hypothetical protein
MKTNPLSEAGRAAHAKLKIVCWEKSTDFAGKVGKLFS